ncbi:MAG: YybH family protein [Gemmatimonadota bacterium]
MMSMRWDQGVMVVAAVCGAAVFGCGSVSSDGGTEAVRAIERRGAEWVDAARREDADALAALYTEDAVLLPPGAEALSGREAIRAMFADQFARFDGEYDFRTEEIVVRDDLAYRWGGYRAAIEVPGGEAMRLDDSFIEIWRRGADGEWRIARDIWNHDVPPPGGG